MMFIGFNTLKLLLFTAIVEFSVVVDGGLAILKFAKIFSLIWNTGGGTTESCAELRKMGGLHGM